MTLQKSPTAYLAVGFFIVFLLLSFYDGGTLTNRGIRVVPNIAAVIIIFTSVKISNNIYIFYFLLLLFLSSITSFGYTKFIFRELTIIFNFLAYVALGYSIIPKLKSIKTNWFLSFYFFIAFCVTLYLFNQLLDIKKDKLVDTLNYILMNLNILGFVFVIASSSLYLNHSLSKKSMLFFVIGLIFILSEITRFALYYSDAYVDLFYYSSRFLYILGLSLLIFYCKYKNIHTTHSNTTEA